MEEFISASELILIQFRGGGDQVGTGWGECGEAFGAKILDIDQGL